MISVMPVEGTNIIELQIDGAVSEKEFEEAVLQIQTAIKTHGKLRVLKQIGKLHLPPIPWSKMWEDLRFGMKHFGDFTHVAVVAEQDWIRGWAKAWDPLLKMHVKAFKPDELAAARQWLREAE